MSNDKKVDDFWGRMVALAKNGKRENRRIMHHVCIRVDHIEWTEKLLAESFRIGL